MSKLSFRARALDASKPMPIYLAEELPDLPDYSAINRAVPQMPSGMEKEEECEHHLQRAISGTGLIIPTPEVCQVSDLDFYERCYPPDYKMPKQHIHMQPLWEEQEAPEYDIDSEDELWLKQQRHPELTELLFEQMMDKLEKCSGQTVVTLNEAKLLLERKDDLVIAVYDYWLNKRLNTQHPLILTVKTESRPGQSTNNPYLAFRRRTEKMQTRKNRKNDESSYEKMLKLRRDLARALTLLQLVARREQAKRDLVRLTTSLADKRFQAGDFANQLLPEPPPRPVVGTGLAAALRREQLLHFPPRPEPAPHDLPRPREKRPYKRRKHRHHAVASTQGLRESGVGTSSEEEGGRFAGATTGDTSPHDDGPFAFRRKPGCYYEMPTTTLYGDPVDPDNTGKDAMFEHEIDERHRYTLTSISQPYSLCVGFARRRVCRLGRVALDRTATPLDDLWPKLPHQHTQSTSYKRDRDEEVELETKVHRTPKEMSRDYHSSGKHPWRHAFRQHLARNPHLWTSDVKPDLDVKMDADDVKMDVDDVKIDIDDVKMDIDDIDKSDLPQDSDISIRTIDDLLKMDDVCEVKCEKSDLEVNCEIDKEVRSNLERVVRKRSWSGCSDSSYDSDESLHPVEKEFEKFITEVNKEWLHFRPKTPPPSPPHNSDDQFPISLDTPLTVELRPGEPSIEEFEPFTTAEFTLGDLYGELPEADNSGSSLDISGDDLLTDNFTGLTEAQVESILSETDLKSLDAELKDKKIAEDILDELVREVDGKEPGRSGPGRAGAKGRRRRPADALGCSRVTLTADKEPIYLEKPEPEIKIERPPTPVKKVQTPVKQEVPLSKTEKVEPKPEPSPVPNSKIIVEEVNEVPQQIKIEKKKPQDTIEEVQLAHGVQLKTVQTKHSPLKKHIITTGGRRTGDMTSHVAVSQAVSASQADGVPPQILTVSVSDSLKVRLQNHLLSSQAGASGATVVGLVQSVANGPFAAPPVAVAVPVAQRDATVGVSVAGTSSPRRVSAPLVQLAPALAHKPLAHPPVVVAQSHTIHHVAPNKLKVLHAHPLTQTQRTQLLAQNRSITQLPAVVSLATLGEAKTSNTALLKAAPGVTQFFEIKGGQLGKGPHLVNVVRQPQPGKPTVARLDLNDAKKRQVITTFDGTALKGNIQAITRPHRVNVNLDGRQIVRAALPAVRAQHVRHQIQVKNRTFQVAAPLARADAAPLAVASPAKTTSIPSSVVANLLHKNVQLPKGSQKIAISGGTVQTVQAVSGVGTVSSVSGLAANVQAIAFTTAQLKARQARLIAQPRPQPRT
ncbi:uncharacterized protein LOC113227842 isoform X2 [Hyposmocoma kahamanoa]|nr:uncharacterized protein LOC113227842 isoform X2 [Hyposmocoma kahamanoa]